MSTPRIQYTLGTTVNLDFGEDLSMRDISYPRFILSAISANGIEERLNVRQDCIVSVMWDMVVKLQSPGGGGSDESLKRKLRSWLSLAEKNTVAWTFARDSAETVLTTLSADALAGATSVTVTSATGITNGKGYVIRNDRNIDIVEVLSVAGSTVNLVSPLAYDFDAEDRFRSEEFWPGILIPEQGQGIVEVPPIHYSLSFKFREIYP